MATVSLRHDFGSIVVTQVSAPSLPMTGDNRPRKDPDCLVLPWFLRRSSDRTFQNDWNAKDMASAFDHLDPPQGHPSRLKKNATGAFCSQLETLVPD